MVPRINVTISNNKPRIAENLLKKNCTFNNTATCRHICGGTVCFGGRLAPLTTLLDIPILIFTPDFLFPGQCNDHKIKNETLISLNNNVICVKKVNSLAIRIAPKLALL